MTGPAPLPAALPEVAWRGGIDLNPLDVHDDDAMAWLETLVWPEDEPRRVQLRHAIAVARADPPRIERGDLLTGLPALVAEAGRHAPVVVFHSAVAAYLTDEDRVRFDELMRGLVADGACHWVSNEAPPVLPSVTATLSGTGRGAHVRARRRRPGGRAGPRPRPHARLDRPTVRLTSSALEVVR